MAFHARGIEHHIQGVDNCLTVINLILASGLIGSRGAGYGTITGQGNGQGGREHGQKADQLPGAADDRGSRAPGPHLQSLGDHRRRAARRPGTSAVEMVHQTEAGEIKGCAGDLQQPDRLDAERRRGSRAGYDSWSSTARSTSSCPRLRPGRRRAARPLLGGGRGDTTNAEGRVIKYNKASEPPGEARTGLVDRLRDRPPAGPRPEKFAFDPSRRSSRSCGWRPPAASPTTAGMTYERIEETGGIFWPCPSRGPPRHAPPVRGALRTTPTARPASTPIEWRPPAEEVDGSSRCG